MNLNLPLLYFLGLEEYCQTSPNKNKSPNLWQVTDILVCCIFEVTGPNNFKTVPPGLNLEKSGTKSTHALKPSLFFVLSWEIINLLSVQIDHNCHWGQLLKTSSVEYYGLTQRILLNLCSSKLVNWRGLARLQ